MISPANSSAEIFGTVTVSTAALQEERTDIGRDDIVRVGDDLYNVIGRDDRVNLKSGMTTTLTLSPHKPPLEFTE